MKDEIIQQILDSGKINKEELDKKIQNKLKALSGLISEEGAAHIVAGELGVQTTNSVPEGTTIKMSDLSPGMKSVNILGKVLRKYELRNFGEDKTGKVGSCLIGDETGLSRLTFWNDKCDFYDKINEGDIVEIQNAYSKENNGRVEIHMGNSSNCIVNPEGKNVDIPKLTEHKEELKKLKEIKEDDNYIDIMATIVQVYDPRFFEVCSDCNKRLQIVDGGKFKCPEHGIKEPTYNYVMNLFLDDGSDNIRASLWKEQIQQLLDLTNEEVLDLKENQQKLEDLKNELLGKVIKARAKVKKNDAFNQLELVLYKIDKDPSPIEDNSEIKKEAPVKIKNKEPTPNQENVVEELITADDEELFNLDDLEDEL
ncbi:MAG: hypothetical protein AB7V77_03100 [Candidatus Woesearchaeota archaeon]